ncbi:precorrin-2 dehydrogenase/sirohydrochlorin ferrochelatase family protein [Geopsychrobacter electrodiphilus]|uniref:precorrin-2 dehydrogenase/sirohydrochlorin ferrochelatase family protein n=1 Tax=Geopsychrobacter electrodiphilus TaxID=225196 RepID=UPI000372B580|nr:NAD(P)-dependent oxidoreductase [Geopsychrobacter electrodiphilus]
MASDPERTHAEETASLSGYTIELRLKNQLVVLIGGGRVGRRKLPDLLNSGAVVKLIDPLVHPDLPQHPRLSHHQRTYQTRDLATARLVFAATNDAATNARIAADAAQAGIFCCRTDSATESDFICPTHLRRPPLSFSISSGGESPALVAVLTQLLNNMVPDSWQTATKLAGIIRRKVLTERGQIPYNQQVLLKLIDQGLLSLIERADSAALDRLLLKHFGAGFSLQDLHFQLPEGTP